VNRAPLATWAQRRLKVMQSGFGTGTDAPVSVSCPDHGSTLKRFTVLLAWFATNSHLPPG
jgi:hypothetical protein